MIRSCYNDGAFDAKIVNKIVTSFRKVLEKNVFGDFDGIACRGTSGLIIAPILAYTFNKKLLVVRKKNDSSHAHMMCEGDDSIKTFIIVDDFFCSGKTVEDMLETIRDRIPLEWVSWQNTNGPECKGFYLWSNAMGPNGEDVWQKEKVAGVDYDRFKKYLKGKLVVQRYEDKYVIDKFDGYGNEDI